MSNKKTMIVVGAGASKEANLPTGHELKKKIASILDFRFERGHRGDEVMYHAFRVAINRDDPSVRNIDITPHRSLYLDAARRIRDAMPQAISIDNFINDHQGDSELELCGKLAIVRSILEAERKSLLYFNEVNSSLNYQFLEDTWFNAFRQFLTENCRAEQLEEKLSSIRLIVFNYDRCIEHFLYHSLQTYYGIDPNQAATLVRGIEIYHPYGTVGRLPWDERQPAVEFGAKPNSTQLVDLASQIKTFTEGADPNSSDVVAIRNGMAESHLVLFLGFAFHRLNLELIQPPQNTHMDPENVRYFGTAWEISSSNCDVITSELVELGGAKSENIALRNDLTCSQLFQKYRRSLSLS